MSKETIKLYNLDDVEIWAARNLDEISDFLEYGHLDEIEELSQSQLESYTYFEEGKADMLFAEKLFLLNQKPEEVFTPFFFAVMD